MVVPTFRHVAGDILIAGLPLDDTDTEHFYALFVDEQTAAYRSADILRLRRFNGLLSSLTQALADRAYWRNCMDPMLGRTADDLTKHIARKTHRKG